MRRSLAVSALAASIVGLGASPAWAHGGEEEPSGGWVPVETVIPDYYEPFEIEACDSTITVEAGDVREVEVHETVRPDGTTVTRFRGDATQDLTRQSDGAMIDELDISGSAVQRVSADGSVVTVTLEGGSTLFPFPNPVELAAFEEAGLPVLTYFAKGEVTLRATVNPETGETLSLEFPEVDAKIIDLCTLFDKKKHHDHGDDDDDDDRHGKKHGNDDDKEGGHHHDD